MKFIGREEETRTIENILKKKGYQGCLIYGRRRIGKTELVKHCLMNKNVLFIMYQCKESSEQDNTYQLTKLLKQILGIEYISFEHFMDAIRFVFEYSKNKEVYFVLDEYPYIRQTIDGCDSKLQEIIDSSAMNSNIKFFLLGSSISIMEEIQSHDNPLYMRFTSQILLRQMDYYDSSLFYPSFSLEDKVRLYTAFGGVPYYNAQIDENITVKENIIQMISGHFSSLKDFIEIYLKSELRKINSANAVFETIALGAFRFKDIFQASHIESTAMLSNVLQKLIQMDLIEYITPINDKTNKHKGGYRISDFCAKFYYNFIYRNESAHNILDDLVFYEKFINEGFEKSSVPHAFEQIAKQYLIRENKKGNLSPELLDIGTYWYDNPKEKKNGQFDVVGKCKDGYVFYECKYTNAKITDNIINEEIKEVSMTNLKPIKYGFFSKSGFDVNDKYSYLLYTLEDLYKK
jgi:uncharacterized protein